MARGERCGPGDRGRGGRRLPPRAGLPLSLAARAARRPRRGARPGGGGASRRRRPPRVRERRHPRRAQSRLAGRRAPAVDRPAAARARPERPRRPGCAHAARVGGPGADRGRRGGGDDRRPAARGSRARPARPASAVHGDRRRAGRPDHHRGAGDPGARSVRRCARPVESLAARRAGALPGARGPPARSRRRSGRSTTRAGWTTSSSCARWESG